MSAAAIALDDLTKYYGQVVGLERVSLTVAQGEVFGFLGAHGAGKTTTIRMLLDLLRPTSGRALVLGFDCHRQSFETRRRIGYLPGEMPMYPDLTGEGYLQFLARLTPAALIPQRLEALFQRFDVSRLDLARPMRDYSHGMQRKMAIIQALMTDAPVLILDEPTSGLDPLMIEAFAETIEELARGGRTTVFLSSHVLSEVERICQRIALIRGGRLVTVRSLDELRAAQSRRVTIRFTQPITCDVPRIAGVTVVSRAPQEWVLTISGPLGPLLSAMTGLPIADLRESGALLEPIVLGLFAEPTC